MSAENIPTKMPSHVWPISRQYSELEIPDTWDTLEEFTEWYITTQKPILVPFDGKIIRTDDATAVCIFRHDRYQVEMYLIHPGQIVPVHAHPGMEVITISGGGGSICGPEGLFGTSKNAGMTAPKLLEGEFHGGRPTSQGDGFVLLSFEKWLRDVPMTSAAIQWKGNTAGPIHDELLTKYYEGSVTEPGIADVTSFSK